MVGFATTSMVGFATASMVGFATAAGGCRRHPGPRLLGVGGGRRHAGPGLLGGGGGGRLPGTGPLGLAGGVGRGLGSCFVCWTAVRRSSRVALASAAAT